MKVLHRITSKNYFLFNLIVVLGMLLIVSGCNSLKYAHTTTNKLPELGTIGVYMDYAFESINEPKGVVTLNTPLRLHFEEIKISERKIFKAKDSNQTIERDSILVSLEILDKVGLVQQLNKEKYLFSHLKKTNDYKIISGVKLYFSNKLLTELRKADEVYLTQNKEKTLSIELRKENEAFTNIEFKDGQILDFSASEFCWGNGNNMRVVIIDIVPVGSACSENSYKNAQRAERRNEFKF